MKFFINLFFILLFGQVARSQNLVRMNYSDKTGVKYDCLLVYYAPDDAYMRIQFTKNNIWYLVDLDYQTTPVKTNTIGQEYFILRDDSALNNEFGIQDCFLSDDYLSDFIPPCFIWYPNSKITNDGLPYVTNDLKHFKNQIKVGYYEEVNPLDITDALLLQFFEKDEKEYAELKALCQVDESHHRALPPLKIIPTMHFIMVVNKDDKGIGVSCSKDQEKLDNEFKSIARTLGIPYKPYFFYCGSDLNRDNLQSKLNQVNPSSNDIVIFSYSGHGSRWHDQKDAYPLMNLWVNTPYNAEPKDQAELQKVKAIVAQNSLGISDVYNIIIQKKARLNIILGDLCNTSIGVPRPINLESYLSFGKRSNTEFILRDTLKLRKLFIIAKGDLISTAAKPDEESAGNASGGYYTSSFVEALRDAASFRANTPTWETILKKAVDNALIYRNKANPGELQTGLRFLKITE